MSDRLLRRLLLRARATAFGRAHDFAGAVRERDVAAAFRARVPVQAFETLRPMLDRALAGEANVLWPGVMRHFAVSGGTTGAGKRLPRTPAHLRLDVRFGRRAARPVLPLVLRGLPSARVLTLPGQVTRDPERAGVWMGEVSGLVAAAAPRWVRAVQAVPLGALDALAWEDRIDRAAALAEPQDIRLLVLVPSWAPVLFDAVRAAHRRRTGRTAATLRDVWPRLGAVVTGGVALASYRAALDAMIGDGPPVRFAETYGASEGFFACQTGDTGDADGSMALDLDSGVAFEFVPADRLGDADAPRIGAHELAVGERYVPVVSTASGLWAYAVGDVVRVTRAGRRPRIVVAGRVGEVLDRYGEAVAADEAAAAVAGAAQTLGLTLLHWHVGADGRGARPQHRWVVALAGAAPSPDIAPALAGAIDRHLIDANRHYAIRRASSAMLAPTVDVVPEAAFRRYLTGAPGARRGAVEGATRGRRSSHRRCARGARGPCGADAGLRRR